MALRLRGATSGYIELKAPASAGDNTLTLPTNNGSANQLLKTDGSGNLSWTDDNSGVSLSGSTNNTIATVTGANALIGEANLTFDGNNLAMSGTGVFTITRNSRTLTLEGNYGNEGHPAVKTSTGHDLRIFTNGNNEKVRITSGGNVNIGGDYSQTDSQVTIVDATKPIAEGTLNLQSSATTGAADTGAVLRFYGHSGTEARYHSSIKGAKENGTSGNYAGYLAFNTRPNGAGMSERLRITSDGKVGIGTTAPTALVHISSTAYDPDNGAIDRVNYPLVVINPEDANGDSTGIGFAVTTSTTKLGAAIHHVREAGGSQGDLRFLVNYDGNNITERLRITSTGRVFIGRTTAMNGGILCLGSGEGTNHPAGEGLKLAPTANTITFFDSSSNGSDTGNIKFHNTVYNNTSSQLIFHHPSGNTGGFYFSTHDGTSLYTRFAVNNSGVWNSSLYGSNSNAGLSANIFVYSDGNMGRASSSGQYKKNIETIQDSYADKILTMRPTWYQQDETKVNIPQDQNKDWGYWGFIAEEVAVIDPRLVTWKVAEYTQDPNDGSKKIRTPLSEPEPDNVAYERFVPHLVNLLKRQAAKIETLETKVAALESA